MLAGFAKILEKIRENPANQVLVRRYLSLLSELGDGRAKSDGVLDLADAVLEKSPRQALHYVHMVYQHDPTHRRALGLMVRCFRSLDKPDKAEMIERELSELDGSLVESISESISPDDPTRREPVAVHSGDGGDVEEIDDLGTWIADLDGEGHAPDPGVEQQLTQVLPSSTTVMEAAVATGTKRVGQLPPVAEMFDYYWQQGFAEEAKQLLSQSAEAHSHEPWWVVRQSLVQGAGDREGEGKGEGESERSGGTIADLLSELADWDPGGEGTDSEQGQASYPLWPPTVLDAIAETFAEVVPVDTRCNLLWDLLQAVWPWGGQDAQALASLVEGADRDARFAALNLDDA